MQPGSLIFLVIVAVWAVYLVQHWIRRRDYLATARSVDRFSDAIRVLERRAAPVGAAAGLYAAPRGARPALVGRRAPAVARPGAAEAPGALDATTESRRTGTRPGPVRAPAAHRGLLARRVRGVVVLAALACVPLTAVLSLAGAVAWVSVLVAVIALVVVLAWTRASVRREQAVRRAARVSQRRRVRPPRSTTSAAGTRREEQAPSVEVPAVPEVVQVVEVARAEAERPQASPDPVEVAPVPSVYDLDAVDEAARAAAAAAVFAQEWSPVPVPTPTYMLKDSAPRPPVRFEESQPVPVPIEVEDDELEQLMAARHRRVVG